MNPPNNLPFAPEPTDKELEDLAAAPAPQVMPVAPAAKPQVEINSMKPQEPEDMFADTAPLRPVARTPVMPSIQPMPVKSSVSMAKVGVLILVILVLLGAAGGGIYYMMNKDAAKDDALPVTKPTTTQPTNPSANTPTTPTPSVTTPIESESEVGENTSTSTITLPPPVTTPPEGVNIPLPSTSTPVVVPATSTQSTLDTDKDGLTDPQEIELGLDPNKADSDGDGLTDGDENKKYGTNPLNPDTDKDTFKDGDEVKNGYNPRGAGKCTTDGCIAP